MRVERKVKESSETKYFLEEIKRNGISFDIDCVEARSSYKAIEFYNRHYGFKFGRVRYVDGLVEYWTMVKWFNEIKEKFPQMRKMDSLQEAKRMWNNSEVQANCDIEQGVIALNKFLAGYDIVPFRVTSRPASSMESTLIWYEKYLPWVPQEYIYIQNGSDPSMNFKKDIIRSLGVGFHLEDSFEHAESIADLGVWVGLVEQPWNKDYIPTNPLIIKSKLYQGRPAIIRAFLSLRDAVVKDRCIL